MTSAITKISVYAVQVPIKEGVYTMSGGRALDAFDTTIARVETKDGLVGWGEVTPLGNNYLPSYTAGARTGIKEIAPRLLGLDATELARINGEMDLALKGHPYVKTAIDIACWDILGRKAGLPVAILLGGRFGKTIKLYRSITKDTPAAMARLIKGFRAQGYRTFQLKVGGEPDLDIARIRATAKAVKPGDRLVADANGGWLPHEAARVVDAVRDLDVVIEQPCQSYEENLTIRQRTARPFVLDESIDSLSALQRGIADGAMDAINIKLSKFGGLSRARLIRDVANANGIATTIEDTACTDITAAAVAALAHSTPEALRFSVTLANVKLAFRTATGAPFPKNGEAASLPVPGLGVEPIMKVLGRPLYEVK
ncbi:MAG: mandelate racemase/muconate lactonizing enzyme family protein [Alphaproteobacteria bacterium]